MIKQKKSQIWIETVLYTAVGLAIIGLLLAAARPKIAATQDEFVIKQTIKALNEVDNTIIEVKQAVGNRRIIEFQLSRGELFINATSDVITWNFYGSSFLYSEPGTKVAIGRIEIYTKKRADKYDISLSVDYKDRANLTSNNEEKNLFLQQINTPYKIIIESTGESDGLVNVDISVS